MLVLASLSPRRRELLGLIRTDFVTVAPDADETPPPGLPPEQVVQVLAQRKAESLSAAYPGNTILGADTIVVLDGAILGKPADEAEAHIMLRALSGRSHTVYTGVALLHNASLTCFCEQTQVYVRALTEEEITDYIRTGEPMDKAGAYGIQGRAAPFISGICGDYYTVVGLPLCALDQKLKAMGA